MKNMATLKKSLITRKENYAQWYLDVIAAADLAEHSSVKGCMVIKPHGYAIWERMQRILDGMIKETGHKNVYFPLFVPKSLLSREEGHAKGFAKECAVVTHYRLKRAHDSGDIVLDDEAKLEEELVVRPTSEAIMYATFSKWIHSWRDLPLLINQWANIVRWEMRTRLFLRTTEFLWQEGHTAHATHQEAEEEALKMLDMYQKFAKEYLAMPVIAGRKSELEKFAGADHTYSIEAMMQDGKALQSGTSHHLGQNFARAFNVQFTDKDGEKKYVWQTSWGVSTRLIGGVIMVHGDDRGLVLPPRIAPIHVVIVPIFKEAGEKEAVLSLSRKLQKDIENQKVFSEQEPISCQLDDRDFETPGAKFNEWEKKGVPLRIEIGKREIEEGTVVLVRRDTGGKRSVSLQDVVVAIPHELALMQTELFTRAQEYQQAKTHKTDDYDTFKKILEEDPGFIWSHWCLDNACEQTLSKETKATIRTIPFDQEKSEGKCVKCGKPAHTCVVFAKAY